MKYREYLWSSATGMSGPQIQVAIVIEGAESPEDREACAKLEARNPCMVPALPTVGDPIVWEHHRPDAAFPKQYRVVVTGRTLEMSLEVHERYHYPGYGYWIVTARLEGGKQE